VRGIQVYKDDEGKKHIRKYFINKLDITSRFLFPDKLAIKRFRLGTRYFSASSPGSRYTLVYDYDGEEYPIGSMIKPYDTQVEIKFTAQDNQEYMLYKGQSASGRIYTLGNFSLTVLDYLEKNESLLNITFNERASETRKSDLVAEFGPIYKVLDLTEYREKHQKERRWIDGQRAKIILALTMCVLVISVVLIVTLGCLGKEKKRRKEILRLMRKERKRLKLMKLREMELKSFLLKRDMVKKVKDQKRNYKMDYIGFRD
jgi:hypothetical protein